MAKQTKKEVDIEKLREVTKDKKSDEAKVKPVANFSTILRIIE